MGVRWVSYLVCRYVLPGFMQLIKSSHILIESTFNIGTSDVEVTGSLRSPEGAAVVMAYNGPTEYGTFCCPLTLLLSSIPKISVFIFTAVIRNLEI